MYLPNVIGVGVIALVSFYSGIVVQRTNQPEPCIRSLYSLDFNFMDRMEQEWIDKAEPFDAGSDMVTKLGIMDTREWALYLNEYAAENDGYPNEIHVDDLGREYVVPYHCYVGKVTWMNEPIMYRK